MTIYHFIDISPDDIVHLNLSNISSRIMKITLAAYNDIPQSISLQPTPEQVKEELYEKTYYGDDMKFDWATYFARHNV